MFESIFSLYVEPILSLPISVVEYTQNPSKDHPYHRHSRQCVIALGSRLIHFLTSSAVAEMGDRLATINMGRKEGCCCAPLGGELGPHLTQCGMGRGLPQNQVASWSIQPFGHNRHGPKFVGLRPYLTQCGVGRGLPPCEVSFWSFEPFGHNTLSQTDRQDNGSIA